MRPIILPLLLTVSCLAFGQGTSYPVFETDKIPAAQFKARREAVKAQLGPGGVAIFFTNPERNRNNDCDFRFRGDSNFLYLTGFEEPDAALILARDGLDVDGHKVTELLFVNESDAMSTVWLGYRMGYREAKPLLRMEAVLPNTSFEKTLNSFTMLAKPHFWIASGPPSPDGRVGQMMKSLEAWQIDHKIAPSGRLRQMLAKLRVKKSPEEIELLRHAAQASAMGHREVFKSVHPGTREYELQAILEYVFTRNGCEAPAYPSIVGSGPNSCILHYEDNRRLMQNGDMICMDAAGEYHGYAADVTRSFPANGKFSPEQKALYEIVLAAQDAGIAACKAGNSFSAAGVAAFKVVADGLMRLGIIKSRSEVGTYLPHGVSHYVGLDVHDAHGDDTLQPDYVLTVEPGIYVRAGSNCDPKWWNIGIRIEDDILVTEKGPENLSAGVPRTIPEIEALMRKSGIGKHPVGQ